MNFHTSPFTYTGEVHLYVTDLERPLKFYTEVIGFSILEQGPSRIVLTADGTTPLLIIEQPEGVTPRESRKSGLYHFALLLPTRADLGKVLIHLSNCGIPLGASDHKVSEALYLSDPDGNGIEIYSDRDPAEWDWSNGIVSMTTDPLDAQSIVAEVDGPWEGLPAGTVMGHIHLHVADVEEAEAFYRALGFVTVSHYPNAVFMSTGNYHHHIALNTWNGKGAPQPSKNSAGLHSFALIYPDDQTLKDAVNQVRGLNRRVEQVDDYYVIVDPSGNGLVLRVK
ncbi:VOC family protein [Sporosarcina cyprini]|uniref:VOC family protein n=1 Tax=Sporosarcina cyprini TaxID=2910523 RepID=UPI001EDDD867|nr:VOC family protein [Sporosarcina cyprini]MCG3086529.1 VOC family protein [Sporosarcina cyprini]